MCRRGNSVSDEVEDPCKGLLVSTKKLSTPKERKRITMSSYPTRAIDLPSMQINLLTDLRHRKGRVEEGLAEKQPTPVRFNELDNLY